jgi:superfamily II DNA or RNA helicase
MQIQLREDQADLIQRTRAALKRHRRVLLQSPTGSGKTVMASYIAGQTAARGGDTWFICHRVELLDGTSKTFAKFGIAHGFIAAGVPLDKRQAVQICSIDTLKGRLATLRPPRIAIIDECHHGSAAGWAAVIKWLTDNGTLVIGLSATPWRLDGGGLDAHFDELIPGPTPAWLMEQGFLSDYRIWVPNGGMDVTGVGKRMGEFIASEVEAKQNKPKLLGDIIAHWRKHADGELSVGFAPSLAFSQYMADQFNMAGIPAAHLDGNTDKGERRRVIQAYAERRILVLWNKGLFAEGFDIAAVAQRDVQIKAVIDAAPSASLSQVMQRWGRGLRPGSTAKLLDHAGNSNRHGFPDDEREWTLEGRAKGKKAANDNAPPPPMTCEGCFQQIRRPLPPCCPGCGKRLQAEAKPLEVADGDLKEATADDKRATRARLIAEQVACKDLGALADLGRKRGYKNPLVWAGKVMGGRIRK